MSLRLLEMLAPAKLEDAQLLAAPMRHYGSRDLGAGDERGADIHGIAAADQQHLFKSDRGADLGVKRLDAHLCAGLNTILLAA